MVPAWQSTGYKYLTSGSDMPNPRTWVHSILTTPAYAFDIDVGSGGSDLWSVRFDDGTNCYNRSNKQCNVDESDYQSRKPVVIDLGPGGQGFSVLLPVSSSCKDNRYDRC